jgi:hypothetical protein
MKATHCSGAGKQQLSSSHHMLPGKINQPVGVTELTVPIANFILLFFFSCKQVQRNQPLLPFTFNIN